MMGWRLALVVLSLVAGFGPAAAWADSLRLDKTTFAPREAIAVHFTIAAPNASGVWIGLLKAEIEHGSIQTNDAHDLTYRYTEGQASGTVAFEAPVAEGQYDFRLNDPETKREIATVAFTVAVDRAAAGLSLPKSVFAPDEEIQLSFTAAASYPTDTWIGLHPADQEHGSTRANDAHDTAYVYLQGETSGTHTFKAPRTEGAYDFRMNETTNDLEIATVAFTVAVDRAAAGLSLPKSVYAPGEEIQLSFTAAASYPNNTWIGLHPADQEHGSTGANDAHDTAYVYLQGETSGTHTFKAPGTEGAYDFRMNETTNDLELATVAFTVRADPGAGGPPVSSAGSGATAGNPPATTPTPVGPAEPIRDQAAGQVLFDNWNRAGCSMTDTVRFATGGPTPIGQIRTWINWPADRTSADYTLYKDGTPVLQGTVRKGECDPYQRSWCQGIDAWNRTLEAGQYAMVSSLPRICRNAGSQENGFIALHLFVPNAPATGGTSGSGATGGGGMAGGGAGTSSGGPFVGLAEGFVADETKVGDFSADPRRTRGAMMYSPSGVTNAGGYAPPGDVDAILFANYSEGGVKLTFRPCHAQGVMKVHAIDGGLLSTDTDASYGYYGLYKSRSFDALPRGLYWVEVFYPDGAACENDGRWVVDIAGDAGDPTRMLKEMYAADPDHTVRENEDVSDLIRDLKAIHARGG
jgi:hypothetical protein